MKEHLAGKGKGSRRSLSSPSVHRVRTLALAINKYVHYDMFKNMYAYDFYPDSYLGADRICL